jgi:hypothetical protein
MLAVVRIQGIEIGRGWQVKENMRRAIINKSLIQEKHLGSTSSLMIWDELPFIHRPGQRLGGTDAQINLRRTIGAWMQELVGIAADVTGRCAVG